MPTAKPCRPSRALGAPALFLLAFLLASLTGVLPLAADPAGDDQAAKADEAVALAARTLDAMGGAEAWEATRFLRFDFFGFRLHHWDRYTGRHRLEGKTREGDAYLVLHDVDSREGRAWLNGEELAGEAAAEWLTNAYEAWINDTYWLLMPYKLRDPGVHLAYDGEETLDGAVYDKVLVTFEQVGLTPGDRYWAYLNRETGLMDRWAYHLEGWEAERQPTAWQWLGWQRYGRVLLAPRRVKVDDGSERQLGQLAVFDQLPDAVFASPAPVAAE